MKKTDKSHNASFDNASALVEMATKSTAQEFLQLVTQTKEILAKEKGKPGKLTIKGKLAKVIPAGEVIIVGDLHGDITSLQHILEETGFLGKLKTDYYLLIFLGDYGDRGEQSPEVYYIIMKLKSMFPEHILLMRGNHEGPLDLLALPHDLPIHLKNKFGNRGSEIYDKLRTLFNYFYTGVIIPERYILLHGGVPSKARSINDIAYAHEMHPREPHLEEILWNDPLNNLKGTIASPRGAGKLFGQDITDKFLKMLNVDVLIRGHQSCPDGYKTDHNQKVLTLFSRKGNPYNNSTGAYLHFNSLSEMKNHKELIQSIHRF